MYKTDPVPFFGSESRQREFVFWFLGFRVFGAYRVCRVYRVFFVRALGHRVYRAGRVYRIKAERGFYSDLGL